MEEIKLKEIGNPPGGILIWFFMILELMTFLGASFVFMYYKGQDSDVFLQSQSHLNRLLGTVNTGLLITSGYFMANSLVNLKTGENKTASRQMLLGVLLGILFLLIKSYEYYTKIDVGIGFEYNTFFTFYWMMTGFHFIHVLFGIGLLLVMRSKVNNGKYSAENFFDVQTSITYWHMCDLIWILIFPIFYLL